MSDDAPYPDESAIEAWLAGKLPPEQAEELERLILIDEVNDIDPVSLDPSVLRDAQKAGDVRHKAPKTGGHQFSARDEISWEGVGDTIGRYRLMEKIGQGGFGDVWRAEQTEPITRIVALKVIRLGMDTEEILTRFDAERQALAMMDHPGIATVLDAGATDAGRPFFVMELVEGVPIDRYCIDHKLDTRESLKIFVDVCSAVEHAHQKGVIHRDLKPSNILVGQHDNAVVPKVIDFGLAKATAQPLTEKTLQTRIEQVLGTPAYMSPEQASAAEGDVDTRSDIYSLGVLLYELLTGTPPFDPSVLVAGGYEEMIRTIREVEPPTPSSRITTLAASRGEHYSTEPARASPRKDLKQELDWVVMKALEKDRERRYQTVGALGDDVLCYLHGKPVSAVAPSMGYRLGKFFKRNRASVLAGAAMVALLIGGAVVSGWQAWRAMQNEERAIAGESAALDEAEKAQRLVEMVKVMFDSADVNNRSSPTYTVRQMLDDFSRGSMWPQLADEPAVAAELRSVIASCYQSLGKDEEALMHAALGLKLRRESTADSRSRQVADDIFNVAYLHYSLGNLNDAMELLEEGSAIENVLGDGRRIAQTSTALSKIYMANGDFERAENLVRGVLKIQEDDLKPGDEEMVLDTRNTLAMVLLRQEKFDAAIALHRRCVADARESLGVHPRTAGAIHNLATALRVGGQPVAAEKAFKEALRFRLQFLEPGDSKVAMTIHSLAQALEDQGRLKEAEALHRRALDERLESSGYTHVDIARAQYWLADNLEKQKRMDEADLYRGKAEDIVEQLQQGSAEQ